MITKFCMHWLKQRGYTVLEPTFVGMVISGPNFVAVQDDNGNYAVTPSFPEAYLIVRNHAYADIRARGLEGKNVLVGKNQCGATTYSK
jgi:hypothetical protein